MRDVREVVGGDGHAVSPISDSEPRQTTQVARILREAASALVRNCRDSKPRHWRDLVESPWNCGYLAWTRTPFVVIHPIHRPSYDTQITHGRAERWLGNRDAEVGAGSGGCRPPSARPEASPGYQCRERC